MPDKDPARIRRMFDAVAPRYDLLNRLLSLGLDRRWRSVAAERLADLAPPGPLLDLACGTGDLTIALDRAASRSARPRLVVGADLSAPMLELAAGKTDLPLVRADGRYLPFGDGALSGVGIAFGLRNLPDLDDGLSEMGRVLRSGGVLGVLEFTRDRARWMEPLFAPWQHIVIPLVGRLLSRTPEAYQYLPESVRAYTDSIGMWAAMKGAGLEPVEERSFSGGVCRLFIARRR